MLVFSGAPLHDEGMSVPEELNEEEQAFYTRLLALFARVQARQPEKGVCSLLQRARRLATVEQLPLRVALERIYQDALERTERRIALLSQCSLQFSSATIKSPAENG